jgi:hypothetical protein
MTLKEFRESQVAVDAAAQILENPVMKMIMDVLETERPSQLGYIWGSNPTDVAVAHGREIGYAYCLSLLRAAGGLPGSNPKAFSKPPLEAMYTEDQGSEV